MNSHKHSPSALITMMSAGHMPLTIVNVAYNAEGLAEYVGCAMQGSENSDKKWRIEKLSYAPSPNDGVSLYATSRFSRANVRWTDRETESYT